MKYSDLNLQFDDGLSSKTWSSSIVFTKFPVADIISFGTASSSFGPMTVFWVGEILLYLGLEEDRSINQAHAFWPKAIYTRDDKTAAKWVSNVEPVCAGQKSAKTISVAVKGTDFQMKVWDTLMRIPAGHVVSYGVVAASIRKPKAVRAVGSAVGKNPLSILIPCHRVIQQSGSVKNYGWGDAMKQKILRGESR